MIYLLGVTVYNGDVLTRLKLKSGDFPMHEYYSIGIRGPLEIAEILSSFNVVKVTEVNGIIVASGNGSEWRHLITEMKAAKDDRYDILVENIVSAIPQVFRNSTSLARL